jgi:thiamine biosynthesis lipoprotein
MTSQRFMNRRDFLQPRSLAGTISRALSFLGEVRTTQESNHTPEDAALVRFNRRAMGTIFEIIFPITTPWAADAAASALDEIDRLENQMTVYRDDSEVSRINRLAGQGPIPVQQKLFELLQFAEELTCATEGAFDIAVGALIKAWGFYRRSGHVPSSEEGAKVIAHSGMSHVVLDSKNKTITLDRGVEINLGSIGKGFALDRAADVLCSHWGIKSALLHGGHSSLLAMGNPPKSDSGWPVGILDPTDTSRRRCILKLRNRAMGTSAATFQNLEYNGRRLGHILDPRTGWPAEGVLSASVTAPSAAVADGLATAFFVMGAERTAQYCAKHPDIGAVLLMPEASEPVVLGRAHNELS